MENIGLQHTPQVVEILEKFLAAESILNLKIRKYHWNIESMKFKELHMHFEDLYNESFEKIDEIAERIRILGTLTIATYKEYLEKSFLDEDAEMITDAKTMITRLVADKEKTIREMRSAIDTIGDLGDNGTEDFLTGLLQVHEKDAWMLRSML